MTTPSLPSVIPAAFDDGSAWTIDSYAGGGLRRRLETELEELRTRVQSYLMSAKHTQDVVDLQSVVECAKAQDRIRELEQALGFDPDIPLYLTLLMTDRDGRERRVRYEPVEAR